MGMSCGISMIKYLLFVFNLICALIPIGVGVATIVLSVILLNYFKKSKKETPKPSTNTKTPTEDAPTKSQVKSVETAPKQSAQLRALQDPNEKYFLPLIEKEELSHDTRRFRFGLPSKDHVLGLPIGQHIHLIATINDELVIRAYTPVSSDDNKGYVDLVIKVYKRNVHPKFPDGGKMSQYVDALKIGDKIAFKGPTGKLQYLGNGKFSIKKLRKDPAVVTSASIVNMIAGGTGITPMLQLVREVLKKTDDKTKLALLYANQTESDILLRKELDDLANQYSDKFKVWYTVDNVSEDWKYSKGFINEEMIQNHLYPPSDNTVVLMCGPPPMINFACQPSLEKLGFAAEKRFAY